ncbi:hypothetical protein GIB67_041356 [Kingdonia uniflora]|uniref:Protein kinase domain-containing protein n=1 Tax=Kingdonia uniflora TaxID=39325 RepID=A0A7J7NIL8_9MAGN|nr:hypothetical protein GIB67_025425 [Kingdonia uniflora]KAF6167101.1 hypothetical protein GIB67_041356 [Kingdonia uniflora]
MKIPILQPDFNIKYCVKQNSYFGFAASTWTYRSKIISGLASALHYLHNKYDKKVIHRDLKANNVMLDFNFNSRLGNAIRDSDIYDLRAVIHEVMCGRLPWAKTLGPHLPADWVWTLYCDGHILGPMDKRLENNYLGENAQGPLFLGLTYSHPITKEMPKMQTIIQIISGSLQVLYVPPLKPAFTWHVTAQTNDDTTSRIHITMPICSLLSLRGACSNELTVMEHLMFDIY